jgi:alpha-L-fucosidase 2
MRNCNEITGVLWFLSIVVIGGLIFSACPDSASSSSNAVNPIDENPNPMRLWYDYPAKDWMTQALPIGNGELGAMFFGGYPQERIQFNEKTLWGGGTTNMGGGYQNFGNLYIDLASHETSGVSDYRRELSISDALGSVSYNVDGVSYKREYFTSFPDKVIVIRFTTPGSTSSLSLTADLVDGHTGGTKIASGKSIAFAGKLPTVSYAARLIVQNEGGTVTAADGKLKVERADAVTFLLAAATNYQLTSSNYIGPSEEALNSSVESTVSKASQKSYVKLKNAHLADYRPLFDRVTFDLNVPEPSISTNQLLRTQRNDNYIDMLYFQYGRYLMLASSRRMNVPNNLQGIWNDSNSPPWSSDIHANINIQMNYWPAEATNLSECHMPFLNYIATESQKSDSNWRKLAATRGARGWTLLTETSIFGFMSATVNNPGNAWYCMHLWQHYTYTLDQNFLRNTAWPSMKSACEFWLDRLRLAADGTYETPDGYSPEQEPYSPPYLQSGVPYDQQLIWDLFNNTLKAGKILGGESVFLAQVQEKFDRLDTGLHRSGDCTGAQLGPNLLAEYKYGNSNQHDPRHRHISHLVGLYPGEQITAHFPHFEDAAKASLNGRGDDSTGWAMGWRINAWARLRDGNRARTLLKAALRDAVATQAGGVYENLFDAHPPFQIDGNFGATSGIAEMLIQSHRGFIEVLPALPDAWSSGRYTGLKAQGNFTIDLSWSGSMPTQCTVYSGSGGELRIRFRNVEKVVQTNPKGSYTISF